MEEQITEEQVVNVIGKAIKEEKYDIACDLLSYLNEERIKNGAEPYSTQDILFMTTFMWMKKVHEIKEMKTLYVAEFEDGIVKIGISKKPKERLETLSFQRGFNVSRYVFSKPISNSTEIEREIHKLFDDIRLNGEYFKINFDEVVETINREYEVI